jgi:hypothetical protein
MQKELVFTRPLILIPSFFLKSFSEVENEELAMDSLQMEWRDSKLRGGEADGIEEQQKYQHENGLLGHYSSKFYGSSQCVGGANEG